MTSWFVTDSHFFVTNSFQSINHFNGNVRFCLGIPVCQDAKFSRQHIRTMYIEYIEYSTEVCLSIVLSTAAFRQLKATFSIFLYSGQLNLMVAL